MYYNIHEHFFVDRYVIWRKHHMYIDSEIYNFITSRISGNEPYYGVVDCGWVNDHFIVWVSHEHWYLFVEKLTYLFGTVLFHDTVKVEVTIHSLKVDLTEILYGFYVGLEDIFPKDKYQHNEVNNG